METFFFSTLSVAIAEIGDKTQLLSLFLAARYRRAWPIIIGILVATGINHGLSAWLGNWITSLVPQDWLRWLVGGSFIAIALWVLIPDEMEEEGPNRWERYGPMLATTVLFFLAEIGDKTQVATVVLAAEYQNLLLVTMGTTLGMLIANIPVVVFGEKIMGRIPLNYTRYLASALFALLGLLTLFW